MRTSFGRFESAALASCCSWPQTVRNVGGSSRSIDATSELHTVASRCGRRLAGIIRIERHVVQQQQAVGQRVRLGRENLHAVAGERPGHAGENRPSDSLIDRAEELDRVRLRQVAGPGRAAARRQRRAIAAALSSTSAGVRRAIERLGQRLKLPFEPGVVPFRLQQIRASVSRRACLVAILDQSHGRASASAACGGKARTARRPSNC